MEGLKTKTATNYKTISYADITEQNLRVAINEGIESGFHKDFDPETFLQIIKTERFKSSTKSL